MDKPQSTSTGPAERQQGDTKQIEPHLTGLRGLFAIQSFVWIFLQTFVPAVVSSETQGSGYQSTLRDIFSPLLWNSSLISNGFILLSLRTVPITFLHAPSAASYAGSLVRRSTRIFVLLSVASGVSSLIFSLIDTSYIDTFKVRLPNTSITVPEKPYNALAALNAIFNLFWLSNDFFTQAANSFWPSQTIWAPAVAYYEGFTVYIIMVILPYTRSGWHAQMLAFFALGSFWYGSWGWYAATGLLLADVSANPNLRSVFRQGVAITNNYRCSTSALAMILMAAGTALKYFTAVLPQYRNAELLLHPFYDLSQSVSRQTVITTGPYPRVDDWLVMTGMLLLVESSERVRAIFSCRPFVGAGERAFSKYAHPLCKLLCSSDHNAGIFTAQSLLTWTAGIKLWLLLQERATMSNAAANAIVLLVILPAVIVSAEVFHRLIDRPSVRLASTVFTWLLN